MHLQPLSLFTTATYYCLGFLIALYGATLIQLPTSNTCLRRKVFRSLCQLFQAPLVVYFFLPSMSCVVIGLFVESVNTLKLAKNSQEANVLHLVLEAEKKLILSSMTVLMTVILLIRVWSKLSYMALLVKYEEITKSGDSDEHRQNVQNEENTETDNVKGESKDFVPPVSVTRNVSDVDGKKED
ncbi:hypothetical protein BCR33DRAFT_852134 [Rhizoclosmatium globosum]|uniref:Uncharacterized protein n=1 Tax=Rhizoclosmatium globosum TaxID=329046 RepID=A0A1Y2C410_9FUNG|nr:hypothetical protein BCR33DRAFT_852134 [Rhizoclosmatium globosum]|eukprot:ORY41624.1 hypothetical protein BCR33DRAFT_852134 [Rhizoclosmatium globosum]